MSNRRRTPVLESLESRELLMGFSMNPITTPIAFDLAGAARGSVRLDGAAEVVNASGVISPIGAAQVTGTLYVVGNQEFGTLKLNSSSSTLRLTVVGTVGRPLRFGISGTTTVPHTAFAYRTVDGSGTLAVHLGPGPRGPNIAMAFTG